MNDFLEALGEAIVILALVFLINGGCRVTINGQTHSIELGGEKPAPVAQPLQR